MQLQEDKDPGGLFNLGRYGPVTEGLAIFVVGITHPGLHVAVDCGEVMTVVHDGAARHRHRAGRRQRPAAVPLRHRPRGRAPRRHRDRHVRVAVPGHELQGGEAGRPQHRPAVPDLRASRALVFLVFYIVWPWEFELGHTPQRLLHADPRHLARRLAARPGLRDPGLGQEAAAARGLDPGPAQRAVQRRGPADHRPDHRVHGRRARRAAPAAAQGRDRPRPGAARPGRGGPADRRPDREPAQGRRADDVPHRLRPGAERRQAGPADPRGRHPDPARGRQRRRPDHRLPRHPGRRDQRARRLADPADPPAGRRRRRGPGQGRGRRDQQGLDVGQLRRVLEDLHARRLPRQPVRAADQPAALPVPPVAVPDHRQRPADLRSRQPPPAAAAASRWTTRASSWQRRTTRKPSGPTSGSGHEAPKTRPGASPRQRRQGRGRPFPGGHPAARPAEQGLPRPLVVPAGRDRAVLVHRPAAHAASS